MRYRQAAQRLTVYRKRIAALRRRMHTVQRQTVPEPVDDYTFASTKGPGRLSQLFGSKRDLIVIHNMGLGCPNCTLWADGYNGLYPHVATRAAFVVASPDKPAAQSAFAKSRGWHFPMVSDNGSQFARAMGYFGERTPLPGISVLRREGNRIVRVSDQRLGPGDDFCAIWHMFDMLPEGRGDWQPSKVTQQ